jgi:soluble lytic murein transglycosylase-like protein
MSRSAARRIALLAGFACLLLSRMVFAESVCFRKAAAKFHVDPLLLYAIAEVESGGRNQRVHINRDGSRDYGVMQVNEANLGPGEKTRITVDPCFAVEKGASVLAEMVARFGYNWEAVGSYNAGLSPKRSAVRRRYAAKVGRAYRILVEKRRGNVKEQSNDVRET